MLHNKLHAYLIEELSSIQSIARTQPDLERICILLDCALHDLKCLGVYSNDDFTAYFKPITELPNS